MRIEDIDKIKLSKAADKELLILKLRFGQLYDKNFKDNDTAIVGSLNRNRFLKSYKLLLNEMDSRSLEHSTNAIDRASFSKAMVARKFGIDVSDFDDIIVVPDCVVVAASNIDMDKLPTTIKKQQSEMAGLFKQRVRDSAYIPIYDLVLKAKQDTTIIEVSKPFPNEHSGRLQEPDKFDDKSFRRTNGGTLFGSKKVPTNIAIIWGKLKDKANPSDPPIAQSLRFPIKDWTAAKAKKWLSDNDITAKLFEPATKVKKNYWTKKYIETLPDSAFLHIEKTESGDMRYYPYKDIDNQVDVPHLEYVVSSIAKSKLSATVKDEVRAKAGNILKDIKEGKKFEKFISVYAIDKADDEHIVCGIVYEPDVVDAQGDKANEIEIRKAAYRFMEDVQTIKVMHKGKKVNVKMLESYIAPIEFMVNKQVIKKGSWVMTVRVLDENIWKAVKDGVLTGFSMAGYARAS